MKNNEIKEILIKSLKINEIYVSSHGHYFKIIAISEKFADMNLVEKQQIIYAPLMQYIIDNRIHSLSIKTYTPSEWQNYRKLNFL